MSWVHLILNIMISVLTCCVSWILYGMLLDSPNEVSFKRFAVLPLMLAVVVTFGLSSWEHVWKSLRKALK